MYQEVMHSNVHDAAGVRRVVITGLGPVTSVGIGKRNFWAGILEGKSGISRVSSFDTADHFTHYGGEVKQFDPADFISHEKIESFSRATQLAVAAASLAVADAGLTAELLAHRSASICFGITSGAVQVIEPIDDQLVRHEQVSTRLIHQLPVHSTPAVIARELNISGSVHLFSTACSAGNYALGYGFDLIRLSKADVVLVGASDPFSRISFTGFNQFKAVAPQKCMPFDKNRKGMMVAEGAGVLVIESLEHALERKAHIYAEVAGYGLSCDAYHMTTSSVEGIAQCMRKALSFASVDSADIDYISAHGTGTQTNDRNECAAIREVFGVRYREIPVSSIKSMLGHTMGAASILEAAACALAIENDKLPPTINYETPDPDCDIDCIPNVARDHNVNIALNNSYAFGGNNASLVMRKIIV